MKQKRWRNSSSSAWYPRKLEGRPGTPGTEAAVAVVCGDGVAGELEAGRSGRRELV
jgi:hypothetical protein